MNQQIVTLSFFKYEGFKNAWWAFVQMGRLPKELQKTQGLSFVKMLGSGGKQGFSIFPNFGLYGLLCVWENEQKQQDFFQKSSIFQSLQTTAKANQTIFLQPLQAHGKWDGKEPFSCSPQKIDKTQKVAVITRAKIKWSKVLQFWSVVAPASKNMYQHAGLIFSVGIGELPLIQQATFSVWENLDAMTDYAYKSPQHRKVLQLTKKLQWYSEELFARFAIVRSEGGGIINLSS